METRIATGIDTNSFYSALTFLKKSGWKLTAEYDTRLFDKGIDFDLYMLTKNGEVLLMAWDNWFEGEIEAPEKTLSEIAMHFSILLVSGAPEHLGQPDFIEKMTPLLTFRK